MADVVSSHDKSECEQRIFLQCPDEQQFGLLLGGQPQMEGLVVVDVVDSSFVMEWNRNNEERAIEVGMLVVEVNGVREPSSMLQQFRQARSVDLLVKNGLTPQQQVVFECSREMHQKSQRAEGLLEKVPSTSSEDACSICYEDQDGKEEVASLPCGHHFHKKCVKKWLVSGHFRCPLCNDDFETSQDDSLRLTS